MVMIRFRSASDAKEMVRKLKKMHRFTKELIECFEDKVEDDDDDDDESYRYDDEYPRHESESRHISNSYRGGRYRRSM